MQILHIITGGTIDSRYDITKDTVVPLEKSIIPNYIAGIKPYFQYRCIELCMKDSRSITQEDRHKILAIIQWAKEEYILVTHGTYTMPDTARYIREKIGTNLQKTIILTGSMIPIHGFSPSDAGFNLWFAIASFSHSPHWVYVAMNAKLFAPEDVIKTLEEGRFSSISEG